MKIIITDDDNIHGEEYERNLNNLLTWTPEEIAEEIKNILIELRE